MKASAACVWGVALVLCAFTGCASNDTHEVRESGKQPYQSVEDEPTVTPGERREGPMEDRAGAQWDW